MPTEGRTGFPMGTENQNTAATRSMRTVVLFPLVTAGLILFICIGMLEIVLHLSPSLFSPKLLNYAFSRYGTFPGAMYYEEPVTGVYFMHRDQEIRASYNGYFWEHQTDGLGFRNPEGLDAKEILLLGDSLVYGHGVEEEDTAAHILREKYGLRVYNMSRQGDSLYTHYILLRVYLQELRPKKVVLFFFANDLFDIEQARTEEQILELPEIEEYDYRLIRENITAAKGENPFTPRGLSFRFASLRLLRGLAREWLERLPSPAWGRGTPDIPEYLLLYRKEERIARLKEYYTRLLGDLSTRCSSLGCTLVLVNLDLWLGVPESIKPFLHEFGEFLSGLARNDGIDYLSTNEIFLDCDECFLKNDGHLTKKGHARLAYFLSEEM